jgi:hypothetical protein
VEGMKTIGDTEVFRCCDYYEEGVGYVFSECNKEIGVLVFEDKFNKTLDIEYRDRIEQFDEELLGIQELKQQSCNSPSDANSSGNVLNETTGDECVLPVNPKNLS